MELRTDLVREETHFGNAGMRILFSGQLGTLELNHLIVLYYSSLNFITKKRNQNILLVSGIAVCQGCKHSFLQKDLSFGILLPLGSTPEFRVGSIKDTIQGVFIWLTFGKRCFHLWFISITLFVLFCLLLAVCWSSKFSSFYVRQCCIGNTFIFVFVLWYLGKSK